MTVARLLLSLPSFGLVLQFFSTWPGVLQFSQIGNGLLIKYLFLSSSLSLDHWWVRSVGGMCLSF